MRTRLSIKRGERFSRSLRIETLPYVYVPITAVTQSAPVRITAPGHGLLDGQRAAIVSVRGMSELNARSMPPRPTSTDRFPSVSGPRCGIEMASWREGRAFCVAIVANAQLARPSRRRMCVFDG